MYLSVMTNYLVFIQIILRNISCNQQDRTVAWISVIFFKKKKKKRVSVVSPRNHCAAFEACREVM